MNVFLTLQRLFEDAQVAFSLFHLLPHIFPNVELDCVLSEMARSETFPFERNTKTKRKPKLEKGITQKISRLCLCKSIFYMNSLTRAAVYSSKIKLYAL